VKVKTNKKETRKDKQTKEEHKSIINPSTLQPQI